MPTNNTSNQLSSSDIQSYIDPHGCINITARDKLSEAQFCTDIIAYIQKHSVSSVRIYNENLLTDGVVQAISQCPSISNLRLSGLQQVSLSALASLRQLPKLSLLKLAEIGDQHRTISDVRLSELFHVRNFPKLISLILGAVRLAPGASPGIGFVRMLKQLPALQTFGVEHTNLELMPLKSLQEFNDYLENKILSLKQSTLNAKQKFVIAAGQYQQLDIAHFCVNDAFIKHLVEHNRCLRGIILDYTSLTISQLFQFVRMPTLVAISASHCSSLVDDTYLDPEDALTQIDEDHIRKIQAEYANRSSNNPSQLKWLNLSCSNLSQQYLKYFYLFKNLLVFNISHNRIGKYPLHLRLEAMPSMCPMLRKIYAEDANLTDTTQNALQKWQEERLPEGTPARVLKI